MSERYPMPDSKWLLEAARRYAFPKDENRVKALALDAWSIMRDWKDELNNPSRPSPPNE